MGLSQKLIENYCRIEEANQSDAILYVARGLVKKTGRSRVGDTPGAAYA